MEIVERKIQGKRKRSIMLVAETLDRIKLKYVSKRKTRFNSFAKQIRLYSNQQTTIHNGLYDIYNYVERLKANYGNPIGHMLEDYFMCIFDYYARFNRTPFFAQLLATLPNQQRFEEWINSLEEDIYPDEYFTIVDINIDELRRKAAEIAQDIIDKRLNGTAIAEEANNNGINIIEV
jgi:hypothetical protein